jgi:hypothetical protein
LFEQPEDGFFTGYTANYVKVYIPGDNLHNQLLPVQIKEVFRDGVLGCLAKN